MVEITLRGRTIPLVYTTFEMKQIQEEIAPLDKFAYMVFGRNPDDENDTSLYGGPDHLRAAGALIRILGNAGLEESGEKADLTDKWVLRSLKPATLAEAVNKCMQAVNEGNQSEIQPKQDEGPVDVTLEKMNKKKEKES